MKKIIRNLASRSTGRLILMDLEPELRSRDQSRFETGGIHFDSIKGQVWMNRVFQEPLDELEVELFDTGTLRAEGATKLRANSRTVSPKLETCLN